jgi:hypothetical protein
MTALVWMGALSVTSWVLVTVLAPAPVNPELALAMGGTLASAMVSWIVTERTQRAAPERVTGVMIAALAAKMVFFGAYVVIVVRLVGVRPVPFVIGFTGYFIGLHAIEALFLKRLFGETARPATGAS